ncbi:pentapeptide repeat-containing protein [Mastigocoleus testarum]|uniref:NACHT domain-containing protein n=1 Tax=Mastigocoleus testarum BC008 TaxID=371196 RepID=A0A0V7ZZT0_9CYAN|nr:pentapeptide repeat-containing protein [Mastigocoleus testarum]KST69814.1 hypothetical protein BC008_36240 [Mastigocoleus testarum BC008]
MTHEPGISIKKPDKFWNKSLKIEDPRNLFSSVGKAALNGLLGNLDSAAENLVEASAELGIAKTPGEIAWLLIYNSLTTAMVALVKSNQDLQIKIDNNELEVNELKIICDYHLDRFLKDNELRINQNFFTNPKDLPIIEIIKVPLRQWLEEFGEDKAAAQSISDRLPTYFVYALREEWNKDSQKYACLTEQPDTPFIKASEQENAWRRYSAWLQRQVEEPMFFEAFGLKQIYVPLYAYYNCEVEENQQDDKFEDRLHENKQYQRVVVDLESQLETWLNQADPHDAIRVISGGPGSGKSSFTKIFAAKQAEKEKVRVLFIPLHQFNPTDDLVDAIGKFIQSDIDNILPSNPLSKENAEPRLLIIFDGLDELAMQGKAVQEVAQQFVREIEKKVDRFNSNKTRLQALITGRELIVQANSNEFRKPEQILHVLPYFVSKDDKGKHNYKDERKLLNEDKRQQWWKKYSLLKGQKYSSLPKELEKNNLIEITSQPLLNYLVALSFIRKKVDFSQESNLNIIYADLLKSVYERVWENKRQHPAVKGLKEQDFIRVLEEIALSSWHGDGRTTTVRDIENHCNRSGLKKWLMEFQKKAEEGVTRLLLAFYFRQSGSNNQGDKTFEFTHKSFGEYLTATRIVREIKLIHKKLKAQQNDPDEGWDEKEALTRWANLCGASPMDEYLFNFVLDEIRLQSIQNPSDIANWQQTLCELISFMLRHGMPMERLNPRPDFHQANQQARNAEEALLVVLNACARVTENISQIEWDSPEAFGNWISRLQGQRVDGIVFCLNHLSFLNLKDCILLFREFYWANLEGVILEGANLYRANLYGANLEGVILEGANLLGATLEGVILYGANLSGANLSGAILSGAIFYRATLEEVKNYESANFKGANLTETVLEGKVKT